MVQIRGIEFHRLDVVISLIAGGRSTERGKSARLLWQLIVSCARKIPILVQDIRYHLRLLLENLSSRGTCLVQDSGLDRVKKLWIAHPIRRFRQEFILYQDWENPGTRHSLGSRIEVLFSLDEGKCQPGWPRSNVLYQDDQVPGTRHLVRFNGGGAHHAPAS